MGSVSQAKIATGQGDGGPDRGISPVPRKSGSRAIESPARWRGLDAGSESGSVGSLRDRPGSKGSMGRSVVANLLVLVRSRGRMTFPRWRGLQPAGVSRCNDSIPQAEARATWQTLQQHQSATNAQRDGFRTARGTELAQYGCHVKLGGVLRNFQPRRDLFIAQARGEHLQNFPFARCQRLGEFVE